MITLRNGLARVMDDCAADNKTGEGVVILAAKSLFHSKEGEVNYAPDFRAPSCHVDDIIGGGNTIDGCRVKGKLE